jgi:hypothetical protein
VWAATGTEELSQSVEELTVLGEVSLAIALANKLARIAWAVPNKERKFEFIRTTKTAPQAA